MKKITMDDRLGRVADRLFLEEYMKNFIASRALELKKIGET
jgi:hypothetical protein